MFFVKIEERVIGNFAFSERSDADRLAQALGGEVVPMIVNPNLSYEETEDKIFRATFSEKTCVTCEVMPLSFNGIRVGLATGYTTGNNFLSSDGKNAVVYVRATSDEQARGLAVEIRTAMVAERVARQWDEAAVLADRLPLDVREEVLGLLADNQKINAIKKVRGNGGNLSEAKIVVDYFESQQKEVRQ